MQALSSDTVTIFCMSTLLECVDSWGSQCENECDCGPGVARCDLVTGCTECHPGWLSNQGYGCVSC